MKEAFNGKYARWDGPIMHITGMVLFFLGLVMVIPTITSLIYSEPILPFVAPMLICIAVSIPMMMLFKASSGMTSTYGIFMVATAWALAILIGAVPFTMSGMSVADAIFESASGFTTTGSTVIADFSEWGHGILLWRSLSQWIGGIAVILIFMSVLPLLGIGGRALSINEMHGSGSRNFSARVKDVAREFAAIYVILTGIMLVICVILGVGAFESLCMTFSTISTGGFLPVGSMAAYSIAVQVVVMIFMFLGGTSFYLHYRAMYKREPSGYLKNTEFKMMLIWFIIVSIVLFAMLTGWTGTHDVMEPTLESFKDVLFTVISLGTTTGLATVDFSVWPFAALFLLALVMFLGGSSGSTAGGVKVYRAVIIGKYIRVAVQRLIHPRGVFDIKMDGNSVEENSVSSAIAIVFLFLITVIVGSVASMLYGVDPLDSVSMTLSSVTNVGPALGGQYGPMASFASLPDALKIVQSVLMWAGRLEIMMALALFTSTFWKEMMRGRARSLR